MASFYDVNAGLDRPNFLAAAQQGYAFGTQRRLQAEADADRNMLRGLAPKVIEGDPNAYAQAAAIDPQAAQTYDNAGTNQLRKLKGFVDYVERARSTGNPQAVNAALRAGAPFLSQLTGGRPPPTEWTPDMDAGWEQLKAKVSMLGQGSVSGVQSTYIDGDGNRVAIMRDGSTQVLGQNDSGMSNQTISVVGSDGRPRQMTFNKRTGNYEPAQISGQPQPVAAPQPQNTYTFNAPRPGAENDPAANLAPEEQQVAGRLLDAGMTFTVQNGRVVPSGVAPSPPPSPSPPAADPFAGQSPAEKAAEEARARAEVEARYAPSTAAAVEGAKIDAQLSRAPDQARADAERERLVTGGKEAAERAAAAPGAIATMQATVDSIDALLSDPELGSVVGLGSINPINYIPGNKGRGLIARADQIAGQAFLAAFNQLKGGGAITELEGAAATAAMARLDRAQGEADYKQALNDLKAAILPAIERQRAALNGNAAPAAPSTAPTGQYQPGQVIEANGKRYRVIGGDPNDPDVEEI